MEWVSTITSCLTLIGLILTHYTNVKKSGAKEQKTESQLIVLTKSVDDIGGQTKENFASLSKQIANINNQFSDYKEAQNKQYTELRVRLGQQETEVNHLKQRVYSLEKGSGK